MTDAANWIKEAKVWALENYENGADTLVECWDTRDYQKVWDDCGQNAAAAWDLVQTVTRIYAEQQADARSYREC